MTAKEIGVKIKEMRKSAGFTQTELAQCVGFANKSVVYLIESGGTNVSVQKLSAICEACGYTLEFVKKKK